MAQDKLAGSPELPQYQYQDGWRLRVIEMLKSRGVSFPVASLSGVHLPPEPGSN
jgi:hypothetical protein